MRGLLSSPALPRMTPCGAGGRVVLALMSLSLSFAAGECQSPRLFRSISAQNKTQLGSSGTVLCPCGVVTQPPERISA